MARLICRSVSRQRDTVPPVRLAVVAITLLAFVLRVYHLDGQSLWYDEGFSVYLAQKSLAEMTARTAADIQPPAYYYILHAWMLVAGAREFAVRFLSVLFGTLTVPLVYLLARRLVGPPTGVLVALLLAVSPFHVWYAQETRMYTLATMLGLLAAWLLLAALEPSRRRKSGCSLWLLYALTNIVAVYTHYYAFFLLVFQAVILALWWLRQGRPLSLLRRGLAAQAAVVLAYLPWARFALVRYAVDESYWEGVLSLDVVRKTLLAFAVGHTIFETQAQVIAVGYLLLVLAGAFLLLTKRCVAQPQGQNLHGLREGRHWAAIFLLLYLSVPFVLLYAVSAWRPKFNPRYLMLASPAFFVLIAGGLERLWASRRIVLRGVAVAGLLYVLATSGYALANNYGNRVLVRDDFRSVAARIVAARQPDEAIILSSGHLFPVFAYYYPDGDVYRIPDLETLSTRAVVTYDVTQTLNRIASRYAGVWLVLWQHDVVDPSGILTTLLDAQAERLPEANIYWGIELRHYRLPPGVVFMPPVISHMANVNFGDRLSLLGYNLDSATIPSDQQIALTLFWQARRPLDEDYWLSLRLVDAAGHVYGRLDQRPAGYMYPTSRWRPGTIIPGQARLLILPGAPPGDYRLLANVFVPARGQSLDVLDAQGMPTGVTVAIGAMHVGQPVSPPSIESLELERVLRLAMAADMELVATNLADRPAQQGDVLRFEIAWHNTQQTAQDYRLSLRLTTAEGRLLSQVQTALTATPYPTTAWPVGSIVRGHYEVAIPADAPSQAHVDVSLLDSTGAAAGPSYTLARIAVASIARTTTVPAMEYRQQASFGDVGALLGYDVSPLTVRAGQTLDLTLYWQVASAAPADRSYVVFTHLLGGDRRIYGQHDSPPAEGTRPTTSWLPGEIIVDRHRLVVKPETPTGEYAIEVGLYDPLTDLRLEAVSEGRRSDHLLLRTPVHVE